MASKFYQRGLGVQFMNRYIQNKLNNINLKNSHYVRYNYKDFYRNIQHTHFKKEDHYHYYDLSFKEVMVELLFMATYDLAYKMFNRRYFNGNRR